MISYYHKTKHHDSLKKIDTPKSGSWIHVIDPNTKEQKLLIEQYNIDEGQLSDALDKHEVPRIEKIGEVTYFYTRVPKLSSQERAILTTPCCIILTSEYIVTISMDDIPELWNPFISGDTEILTTQRTKFFFTIMTEINKIYHLKLTRINRQIRRYMIEDEEVDNDDLLQFVKFERSINDFLDALVPTNGALETILKGKYIPLYESDRNLIEDLSLSEEQLATWSKATLRTIQNVRDAYSSILTNRLNKTIKLLTVITVILTVPTMIAGLFGMNIQFPFNTSAPEIFWLIILGSLVVSSSLFLFFFKK